jgi:hypothetical protein
MAIKRYIATSDNTITNAYQMNLTTRGTGSNMGAADTLEAFYIFGQVSSGNTAQSRTSEKSRILIQFDVDKINADRTAGLLPASGNVAWYINMYNAPHSFTLPKDFKMVVKVCSGSWQEGRGLDVDNYTDQTYEGTGSNWVRKGATGDGYSTWLTEGGDFAESSLSPAYTASFTDGTEDLSVDISDIVEDWLVGGVAAAGVIIASETGTVPGDYNGTEFSLTDAQGTSVTFKYDTSTAISAGSTIGLNGASSNSDVADRVADAINNTPQLRMTAIRNEGGTANALIMQDIGLAGNTIGGLGLIDISSSTGQHDKTDFVNGTGIPNFGLGVFMSASYETGSYSYYTKKFFARSSEYFFLRPNLEARWDDAKKDNAANFALSSSLATGDDNLNTLYLYNYVKGKLQNIPDNPSHSPTSVKMMVSLYSNSAGNIYDKLALPKGGDVAAANNTNVTGGIYIGPEGAVDGVYTASLAMTHSLESVYPVWHYEDLVSYHTGSAITVNTLNASNHNPDPDYVTTIDNLKTSYSREEQARFRLFVRSKNWNPNNYTTMQSEPPSEVVEDAYYSLHRIVDEYVIIPFGTGSATSPQQEGSVESYTRLSYDISGNYFDFDMSLLQAGYEYGLKLAYYSNGSYREQKEVFKFKVEE